MVAAAVVIACSGGPTDAEPTLPVVAGVAVTAPAAPLWLVGDTVRLAAVPRDAAGQPIAGVGVRWLSGAPGTATVSDAGLVTAVGPGTATITATADGVRGVGTIGAVTVVVGVPGGSLSVSPDTVLVVAPATTATVAAAVRDAQGAAVVGAPVQWRSTAPAVATVSAAGVVSVAGPGSALLIAELAGVADSAVVHSVAAPPTPVVPPVVPPVVAPAIRVVGSAAAPDTVGAFVRLALYVEVTDSAGRRAAGVEVRFASPPLAPPPYCVGGGCAPGPGVVVGASSVTGADGRTYLPVRLGSVAGDARVLLTVPALGVRDSARYTILPGQPSRVVLAPRDTFVYRGTTLPVRAAVADRVGNARAEAPALSASPGTPLTGSTLTAAAYGVHWVVARHGDLRPDSTAVSVVPRGTIAAVEGYGPGEGAVVVFDFDGTRRARIPVASAGYNLNGLAWTPDGSRVVYSKADGAGYRLHAATLAGSTAPLLPARIAPDEEQPAFSRDGRWLYFGEKLWSADAWRVWRARPDGSGAQPVGAAVGNGTSLVPPLGLSPDGARVAYGRGFCCPTTSVLSILDAASGAVTEFPIPAGAPRWSPAGDRIAYATPTGPTVINPDGTGTRSLSQSPSGFRDVPRDWSPDGRWLIAESFGPLVLVDVESGERIPLPYMGGAYQPSWRP